MAPASGYALLYLTARADQGGTRSATLAALSLPPSASYALRHPYGPTKLNLRPMPQPRQIVREGEVGSNVAKRRSLPVACLHSRPENPGSPRGMSRVSVEGGNRKIPP